MISLLLFLFLLHGTIYSMEKPSGYNQELTEKLKEKRHGHEVFADNYGSYWPVIKKLIEQGANPNSPLDFGSVTYISVLYYIIGHGSVLDGMFLLNHGASCDGQTSPTWTPLGYAIFCGKKDFVKLFLDLEVDANYVADKFQQHNPLMIASHNGSGEIAQNLLNHGADQSVLNVNGKRAVDIAKDWNSKDVALLLQKQKIL